jgi:hypothetical protein
MEIPYETGMFLSNNINLLKFEVFYALSRFPKVSSVGFFARKMFKTVLKQFHTQNLYIDKNGVGTRP